MITEQKELLQPKKVYLPLTDLDFKIANVHVEEGETVMIGQNLADKFKGKEKFPVVSTVSGTVVGFEERMDRYGKIVDHIVIENDGLDTTLHMPAFEGNVSTAEIRNQLYRLGIRSITIDGLYSAIDFELPIKHVVVNAIFTNEPFVSTDYDLLLTKSEQIADGIALLAKAANAETATIIVDRFMPEDALEEIGKAIVDRNIELVTIDTKKINGADYKVIKKLVKEQLAINVLENGVIYTSTQAALMVHEAVRDGKVITSRPVAILGDGLPVNAIYDVRIGTLFEEIVTDLGGYQETPSMNLHIGSYLTGVQVPSDQFSITANVDAINVSVYREVEEDVCIKCGDCNDICPAGILPQNIMDAELRAVSSRIVELNTNECVECGLCTYVCPSKINVLEWVRRAKRRVG